MQVRSTCNDRRIEKTQDTRWQAHKTLKACLSRPLLPVVSILDTFNTPHTRHSGYFYSVLQLLSSICVANQLPLHTTRDRQTHIESVTRHSQLTTRDGRICHWALPSLPFRERTAWATWSPRSPHTEVSPPDSTSTTHLTFHYSHSLPILQVPFC